MNIFRRSRSMLSGIEAKEVSKDPFPHVALDGFLNERLAQTLAQTFPPLSQFTDGTDLPENKKLFLQRAVLQANPGLSADWKAFLKRVNDFKLPCEIGRIFAASMREYYPDFEARFGSLSKMKVAYRYSDQAADADLKLDYKCAVHSPSPRCATFERGAHCKGHDKLAELHLFLRHPDDLEGDCDLVLFRKKGNESLEFSERNQVPETRLEEVKRIPYQTNRGILFLNTRDSITKITPRCSPYPLQYFILVFELPEPLFHI